LHTQRPENPSPFEQIEEARQNHAANCAERWALLLVTTALLIVLSATIAQARSGVTGFPDWLEPRALNIVDLVGEIPESILQDTIISYGDNTGIIVYQAGRRISQTVIITTTIYPRYQSSNWAPNNSLTLFGCLGQFPYYDHMGSLVPTSTLRIYDSSGADVTPLIQIMSLTQMGTRKPLANTSAYIRYPEFEYGLNRPRPLPMTKECLLIPPNAGCHIWIPGHNLYPLTGIFRLEFPPTVEVAVRGQQRATFRSYIGMGNVGIFAPLMNQLRSTYPDRHARIYLNIPPVVDYVLVKFPPMPGDAYMDSNAQRPTGGTYRLALDINRLSTDLIFTGGFPTEVAWRDHDQAPKAKFLPEMVAPHWLAPPEYVIPAGVPYNDCFTRGNCPGSVLEEIYEAQMELEITFLKVIRRVNNGAWVPVRFTGPAWSPSMQSAGVGLPRPAVQIAGPEATPPLTTTTGAALEAAAATFAVEASPTLTIAKSVTPEQYVGYHSPAIYTLALRNIGSGTAEDIQVADNLTGPLSFDHWLEQPEGVNVQGTWITWTGSLATGEAITLTFVVNQTADPGETITNTAHFSHTTGNGTASTAFTVEASPTLSIIKSVAPEQDVGYRQPVTYALLVRNGGQTDALGVLVTDTLHPDTAFSRWIEQPTGATATNQTIAWTGPISVGKAVTLTYLADQTASFGATIINTAQYRHAAGHGATSAAFHVEAPPALEITKTVHPDQNVGYWAPVVYTIVVRNTSSADAPQVTLIDTLPSATSFEEWIDQPAGALATSHQITWTGAISAQQALTLTFVANQSARPGSTVENRAEIHHLGATEMATASFTLEPRSLWPIYLPLIVRGIRDDPIEPLPDGCPCGWFDELGRMLDFTAGY